MHTLPPPPPPVCALFAPPCSLNMFFITWSVVVLLLLVGVLLLPKRAPTAGLLTSGAVFLYCRSEKAGGEGNGALHFSPAGEGGALYRWWGWWWWW